MVESVVITSAARTAIGAFGGTLKDVSAIDLGTIAARAAIERSGLDGEAIGHSVIGNVIHGEARDMYISRVISVNAGVSRFAPALTVNRLCGSGLQAIVSAAQTLMLGDCDAVLAGGAESMSNGGYLMPRLRFGARMGETAVVDMMQGALYDPFGHGLMGITAENIAERYGIDREAQDAFALESQRRAAAAIEAGDTPAALPAGKAAPDTPEGIVQDLQVDALELGLSYDIVDLVDANSGGDLLVRVKALRRKLAMELGLVLPTVRTRDDTELPLSTYRIRLHGVEVARGQAPPGHVLVIGDDLASLPGDQTKEPVFGLDARWVPVAFQHQAELMGATVVDRASILTTHLAETVRKHAAELLSREDVKMLVDSLKQTQPTVVEELTPAQATLGEIQRVLQGLLRERVAIRDLARIFEAMSASIRAGNQTTEGMIEAAREVLGAAITTDVAMDGVLHVITLEPTFEQSLLAAARSGQDGQTLAIDAAVLIRMSADIGALFTQAEESGISPIWINFYPLVLTKFH